MTFNTFVLHPSLFIYIFILKYDLYTIERKGRVLKACAVYSPQGNTLEREYPSLKVFSYFGIQNAKKADEK